MSKIITIFTAPDMVSSASVSDTVITPMDMVRQASDVDESSFDKARYVSKLYKALLSAQHAQGIAADYIVTDSDDIPTDDLTAALDMFYTALGRDTISGSMEITDAQYDYLSHDNNAMQVCINNAIINPDTLDWTPSTMDTIEDAATLVHHEALSLEECIYTYNDIHNEFYGDDDEDWYNEDWGDEDWGDEDDDWDKENDDWDKEDDDWDKEDDE